MCSESALACPPGMADIASRDRPRCGPQTMKEEWNREQESEGPVKQTCDRPQPLVAQVIEEVSTEDQPQAKAHHYRAGTPSFPARQTRRDVRAPEYAEYPDRTEREGAVKRQPPRLQSMGPQGEVSSALNEVVKQQPEATRKPEPAADDIDPKAAGATDGERPLRFERRSHQGSRHSCDTHWLHYAAFLVKVS